MNHLRQLLLVSAVVLTVRVVYSLIKANISGASDPRTRDPFSKFTAIALLNFVAFWWIAVLSGGDALNGHVIGDQCFLGDHGRYTPVSRGFWMYSFTHTVVTIVSFGIAIVGQFVGMITGRVNLVKDSERLHPRGRGTG